MATVTARPNATDQVGGWADFGGSPNEHSALSDNSDTTYIAASLAEGQSGVGLFGIPEPTLPAGAIMKSVALRVRRQNLVASAKLIHGALVPPTTAGQEWANRTTVTVAGSAPIATITLIPSQPVSVAEPFSGWRIMLGESASGPRIFEAYVDIVYVVKPELDVHELGV